MQPGENFTNEYVVFILDWDDGENRFVTVDNYSQSHIYGRSRLKMASYSKLTTTPHFESAGFIEVDDIDTLVEIHMRLRDEYPSCKIYTMTTNVSVDFKAVDITEGEILAKRQMKAIEKLSSDDIEALGLQKFVVYDKIRNYNTDGLEMLDD